MTAPSQEHQELSLWDPINRLCAGVCRQLCALVFKLSYLQEASTVPPRQGGIFRLEYDRLRYTPTPRVAKVSSVASCYEPSGPIRKAAVRSGVPAQVHEIIRPNVEAVGLASFVTTASARVWPVCETVATCRVWGSQGREDEVLFRCHSPSAFGPHAE